MTPDQMTRFQKTMGVAEGSEWDPLATINDPFAFKDWLGKVPFFEKE